jgi:hypothetical protein
MVIVLALNSKRISFLILFNALLYVKTPKSVLFSTVEGQKAAEVASEVLAEE